MMSSVTYVIRICDLLLLTLTVEIIVVLATPQRHLVADRPRHQFKIQKSLKE